MKRVGVVDIGSNSIKLLVLAQGGAEVIQQTEETRISQGITGNPPRLSEPAIANGVAAVAKLVRIAKEHGAEAVRVVATSAVRDAVNRSEFVDGIRGACALPLDVLSGEQEAGYIALGIAQEPALQACAGFMLADLGGGSMEVLTVAKGELRFARSLQVGAVRYLERFTSQPAGALEEEAIARIREAVRAELDALPEALANGMEHLVLTGGAITFARKLLAESEGKTLQGFSSTVPVTHLEVLLSRLAPLDLEQRIALTQLPANRADIMPVALTILSTVASYYGFERIQHSFFNLKYGVAAEMLARP